MYEKLCLLTISTKSCPHWQLTTDILKWLMFLLLNCEIHNWSFFFGLGVVLIILFEVVILIFLQLCLYLLLMMFQEVQMPLLWWKVVSFLLDSFLTWNQIMNRNLKQWKALWMKKLVVMIVCFTSFMVEDVTWASPKCSSDFQFNFIVKHWLKN